jgi:hypothetical protein
VDQRAPEGAPVTLAFSPPLLIAPLRRISRSLRSFLIPRWKCCNPFFVFGLVAIIPNWLAVSGINSARQDGMHCQRQIFWLAAEYVVWNCHKGATKYASKVYGIAVVASYRISLNYVYMLLSTKFRYGRCCCAVVEIVQNQERKIARREISPPKE